MNNTIGNKEGIPQHCKYCNHEWTYTGQNDKSTCSQCSNKNWVLQAFERWEEHNDGSKDTS